MKVSVIIPAYNEEGYIAQCLTHLLSQIEMADEVIVVDNNSTDKTAEIVKTFPVTLITEKKQGITPARNAGFNSAHGDILCRVDADTIVPKDWIRKIKRYFAQNPNLVAVSGPTIFRDRRIDKLFHYPQAFMLRSFKKIIGADCLYGPNMAITKTGWEAIKDFVCPDDRIVHEDFDIAIHLAQLQLGDVIFDKRLSVSVSERRWKKIKPYFNYPYRYLRTLQHHKQSLHSIKTTSALVGKVLPKPKKILKKIKSGASSSIRFAKSLTP